MSEAPEIRFDAVIKHLESRIPGDLSDAEIQTIRKGAAELLRSAAKLRSVRLSNADEPAPIFHPHHSTE